MQLNGHETVEAYDLACSLFAARASNLRSCRFRGFLVTLVLPMGSPVGTPLFMELGATVSLAVGTMAVVGAPCRGVHRGRVARAMA